MSRWKEGRDEEEGREEQDRLEDGDVHLQVV